MRQIIASAFVSLDGVMQAPGGQDEDRSGGFRFGGWTAPYWDDAVAETMSDLFSAPFDLLLGRRTYDIFAGYWPHITDEADPFSADIARVFNQATKYVATHHGETLAWENSQWLGRDILARRRHCGSLPPFRRGNDRFLRDGRRGGGPAVKKGPFGPFLFSLHHLRQTRYRSARPARPRGS